MSDKNLKYKYVITSGWWCGDDPNEKRVRYGSEEIRSVSFFRKWKKSVLENTKPQKILIVDSNSPTKPDAEDLNDVEFVSLSENAGHSTAHTGKYCGYMRSVIMGLTYASLCDCDYWVYVEQDALLQGEGIIEHCIEQMEKPYMFGDATGVPQLLQQSMIIIRRDGFEDFLKYLNNIELADNQMPPETKFALAASPKLRALPRTLFMPNTKNSWTRKKLRPLIRFLVARLRGYEDLPIGYGRARPIDFSDSYLYFQHASEEELSAYTEKNEQRQNLDLVKD